MRILYTAILVLITSQLFAQNEPMLPNSVSGSATATVILPSAYNTGSNPNPTLFNYQRVFTPQLSINNEASLNESSSDVQVKMQTIYKDGLGRTMQTSKRNDKINGFVIQPYDYRPSNNDYAFVRYFTVTDKFQKSPFADQKTYFNTLYPADNGFAVSKTQVYSDANNRGIKDFDMGKSNLGQDRAVKTIIKPIGSAEIPKIFLNSSQKPEQSGYYASGSLTKNVMENTDGAYREEVIDKEGKLIRTKVQVGYATCGSTNPGGPVALPGSCPTYDMTYYVYDDFGRLRYTISPLGYNQLLANGWDFTDDLIEHTCNYQNYDDRGRIKEKHTAGAIGVETYVYDKKSRLVLNSNPAGNGWKFTFYDALDRVTVMGNFNDFNHDRNYWQSLFDNANPNSYTNTSTFEYIVLHDEDQSSQYLNTITYCDPFVYNYYDAYKSGASGYPIFNLAGVGFDFNEYTGNLVSNSFSLTPAQSSRTRSLLTGKKIKVLKPSGVTLSNVQDWIYEIYYYDDNGNLIQTRQKNYKNSWSVFSTQYDFKGRILKEIRNHNNSFSTKPNTKIVSGYIYQPTTFQLLSKSENIDNLGLRTIVQYNYNFLGQVIRKKIGSIEQQDYLYNVRGQLSSINLDYVDNPTASYPNKSFGEILNYDYGHTNKYYHGDIAGIVFRGPGASTKKSYGYTYDLKGRMIQADFSEWFNSDWTNSQKDFTEGNIEYDPNGNIRKLKRYGPTLSTSGVTPGLIDDLTYTYQQSNFSNRLASVQDNILVSNYTDYDFKDDNTGSIDYVYDPNGNMIRDLNKKIAVSNNWYLDKPDVVTYTANNDKISYVYDGLGNKLIEVYNLTAGGNNVYEYLGEATYLNGLLSKVNNAEGYAEYNSGAYKYFFFVKDHLGNVRNLLESTYNDMADQFASIRTNNYNAGFESASASFEGQFFSLLNNVRDLKPLSSIPTDVKCAKLDANDPQKRVGACIMLNVKAGDKFDISAQSYYQTQEGSGTIAAPDMMNSIVTSLLSPSGLPATGETAPGALVQSMFNSANYLSVYENIKNQQTNPAKPRSYINYMLFDEDFKLVPEASGVIQMSAGNGWQPAAYGSAASPNLIKRSGTLVVYVSSEDKSKLTFWDLVLVNHYKGVLADETHYYPYGLAANMALNPTSNRNLFQTKQLEKLNNLHYNDFNARVYDPQLGKWNQKDPFSSYSPDWSPYKFEYNNPVSFIDPTGMTEEWYATENDNGTTSLTYIEDQTAMAVSMGGQTWVNVGATVDFSQNGVNYYGDATGQYSGTLPNTTISAKTGLVYENVLQSPSNSSSSDFLPIFQNNPYDGDIFSAAADGLRNMTVIAQTSLEYLTTTTSGMAQTLGYELKTMTNAQKIGQLRTALTAKRAVEGLGKKLGAVGLALTVGSGISEYLENGSVRPSTGVDVIASAVIYAGSTIPSPVMPIFWVGGIIYTGTRMFNGDNIDKSINGGFDKLFRNKK